MSTVTATKTRTYDMAYIAIFAVLIAICSWISIPMTVPFTLQTFGVFMAVGVLGGKRGLEQLEFLYLPDSPEDLESFSITLAVISSASYSPHLQCGQSNPSGARSL